LLARRLFVTPSLRVSLLDRIQTQNSQVKSGVFNPVQNFFKISLRNSLHQGIRYRFVSLPRGGCIGIVCASTARHGEMQCCIDAAENKTAFMLSQSKHAICYSSASAYGFGFFTLSAERNEHQ
jgi:hypothetical protein